MGSKDPIQVAREILERDLASTTEQEEILESVEEVEEDIEIEISAGDEYDDGSDYGGGFGFGKAGSSSEQSFGSVGGFD